MFPLERYTCLIELSRQRGGVYKWLECGGAPR